MRQFCFLLFLLIGLGCTKERPQPQVPKPIKSIEKDTISIDTSYSKVFILSQGIWPNDNSSIAYYNEKQGLVSDNYFKFKNSNAILGSVPQCMTKVGSNYFVVVNNASKIIALDSNFVKIGEVTNLLSPRYMLPLLNDKAYVTDLSANAIHIINTATLQKTGSISCNGWCEQLLAIGDKVYVTNYKKNQLYIINSTTDVINDSITITKGAEAIAKDKNSNLWVMCTSIYNTEKKYLYCINPNTKAILKTLEFAAKENPSAMHINKNGDKLYFINKHVYSLNISDVTLPSNYVIDGNQKSFYSLGINPSYENIYVSDTKGGSSVSKIYVYKSTGESITNFDAGYFSGYFFFDK